MPMVRSALVAVLLSLGAVGALPAQDGWNDARSLELVRAATARRALQLADTGLRSYTARATGYLTFLGQFGDGFRLPPAVIKTDQLALEVYWAAPDRSKQRIVGRRDTLLLPTDINYHRDHLGIIQNNFPDIIRLGDGDEVLDVPHPLAPIGPSVYDYRLSDSLSIRGQGVSLDVMMVSVRPKDPQAPAAVGAVYIDRATSSVVRMTFSFTRAALRDRQLEDVSVILENGLVEGRFWLPRRQEIEIRRSASWMDFPARGIIRGRWEICCVEANLDIAPQTFLGAEIVEAGTAEQLRQHPFEGEILDQLPDEVRALDDAEVRAVQEEARRLVQAGALARVRSGNLAARRISDFARFDRVEGLAIGAGLSQRLGGGFLARLSGRYGTADSRWKGEGSLAWRRASGLALTLTGRNDWRQLGEVAEVSGLRNSVAAQEFGSDWTNPVATRGASLELAKLRSDGRRLFASVALAEESALSPNASSAWGRVESTLPIPTLERRDAALGWEQLWLRSEGAGRIAASLRATGSEYRSPGSSEWGNAVLRLGAELEIEQPLRQGQSLRWRTLAAGTSRGDVPLQDQVFFGRPSSGPGYDFHSLVGALGVSQRMEWQLRVPFLPINLGRFGRVPGSLTLAPFAHGVWIDRPLANEGGWYPALGLGAIGFFDLLRLDVARGLRDGRWTFSLDVTRTLWPVL